MHLYEVLSETPLSSIDNKLPAKHFLSFSFFTSAVTGSKNECNTRVWELVTVSSDVRVLFIKITENGEPPAPECPRHDMVTRSCTVQLIRIPQPWISPLQDQHIRTTSSCVMSYSPTSPPPSGLSHSPEPSTITTPPAQVHATIHPCTSTHTFTTLTSRGGDPQSLAKTIQKVIQCSGLP